jgi:predicted nucleic acid-binding protein
MTVVVSDTSPIRAFKWLGLLPVLQELYTTVLIPPAVARELDVPPRIDQRVDLSLYSFLAIESPADTRRVRQLMNKLDAGESEAIALAEERAALLVVDDAAARRTAVEAGLATVGSCVYCCWQRKRP